MTEQMPENTIRLGDNAYLLESPNLAIADCLVIAHGGIIDKTRKFTVPAGITIEFFVEALQSNSAPDGLEGLIHKHITDRTAIAANPALAANRANLRYEAQSACPDYILAKAFGTHYDVVDSRTNYSRVRDLLQTNVAGHGLNWIPHVVTVRNRKSLLTKQNVWLSVLVEKILAAKPGVTTIYCANCRVAIPPARAAHYAGTVGSPALGSAPGR